MNHPLRPSAGIPALGRRGLIAGGLLSLAACSSDTDGGSGQAPSDADPAPSAPEPEDEPTYDADRVQRLDYGPDPTAQFGELRRSKGPSKGIVVIIHGGFWLVQYDLSLGEPLSQALVDEGWTAYNVEYRRVGSDGGWPETFDDIAAAIDALADVDDLDLSTVLTLGHSAGGQLAVWAAARGGLEQWQPVRVPVTGCVSQAGVLDMTRGYEDNLGGGAVEAFLDRPPGEDYRLVDPTLQVPLDVPVRCIHGTADSIVPIDQSERYVAAATAAGADASLTAVEGDHFTLIDPSSDAWREILGLLEQLRA